MNEFTQVQIMDTLKLIESSIINCEKGQPKLKDGSSSLSLNKNRIKALYIAKGLLNDKGNLYSKEELDKAITQITSIRNKSISGINNTSEGSKTFTCFFRLISAMDIVLEYLHCAVDKQK